MSLAQIVTAHLKTYNLVLPSPPKPGGNYLPVNIVKDRVFVAIQFPKNSDGLVYAGRLGKEFDTAMGYKAAAFCAINVLAQVNQLVGFDRVLSLNHFDAYYQATDDWDEAPLVVDGASDLFVNILGDAGKHTRAILGVHRLPRNFVVGITASFTLQ